MLSTIHIGMIVAEDNFAFGVGVRVTAGVGKTPLSFFRSSALIKDSVTASLSFIDVEVEQETWRFGSAEWGRRTVKLRRTSVKDLRFEFEEMSGPWGCVYRSCPYLHPTFQFSIESVMCSSAQLRITSPLPGPAPNNSYTHRLVPGDAGEPH